MYTVLLVVHIILAISITIFVLMQRSEGGALGGLGGSQGASGFLTGRQTGNFLTKATSYMFVCFVITSLSLVILSQKTPDAARVSIVPTTVPVEAPVAPVQK